jgi:hypothetical protein
MAYPRERPRNDDVGTDDELAIRARVAAMTPAARETRWRSLRPPQRHGRLTPEEQLETRILAPLVMRAVDPHLIQVGTEPRRGDEAHSP